MKKILVLELLICLLTLSACMHEEEEETSWWCGYYNNCHKEENTMCGFYGNCPDKGSVWGKAGSDVESSHVGGIDHPDGQH